MFEINNLLIIVIYCLLAPLEMILMKCSLPNDSTVLTLFREFNLPFDNLQSHCLLSLLHAFFLTFNSCSQHTKEEMSWTWTSVAPTLTPTLHAQDYPSLSLSKFYPLSTEDTLHVILLCNPSTCTLDPILSTVLQSISQDLPFISTIIRDSTTSHHMQTVFKTTRFISIQKKPTLGISDISSYQFLSHFV